MAMKQTQSDPTTPWRDARTLLIPLAALWATLWMLVSVVENSNYFHDPSSPRWQGFVLISVPTLTIIVWLIFEFRSARYQQLPLEPLRPWIAHFLWRLPALAIGYIVIVFGLRHGIFAAAGAEYNHIPWQGLIPFELIKATLFYCLWLGLVYGTLSLLRSREQSAKLALIEKALVESRLALLQAQLRPHFLFNTLNTVSSLMQIDIGRADRVLTRLGDLLRASLGADKNKTISLDEELQLLRLYTEIMQERFPEHVMIEWRIDDEALAIPVPAMLLQPLVENAFKYGIEQSTRAEKIHIVATVDQDRLKINIYNTGSLLSPEWREGIGIGNCRERLRVLYGRNATVAIENDKGAGVVASISLPLSAARE
jgi:two-component system, LytTR family, sensor kinase